MSSIWIVSMNSSHKLLRSPVGPQNVPVNRLLGMLEFCSFIVGFGKADCLVLKLVWFLVRDGRRTAQMCPYSF